MPAEILTTAEVQKRFDHHLLTLKLHEPSRKMHEEVSVVGRKIYAHSPHTSDLHTRLIDAELAILQNYLGVVDGLARQVWQLQGNAITPEFVRAMPHILLLSIIEARAGSIKHGIELHNIRTRQNQDLTPALQHLAQRIAQLVGTILNRYEAEARTLEYQQSTPTNERIKENGVTTMKTDIWRQFHYEFQALADEEQNNGAAQRDRFIRAYCTYDEHPEVLHVRKHARRAFASSNEIEPVFGHFVLLKAPECGLWTLSEGLSENLQGRFRTLSSRAGVALGCPHELIPEDFWLHRLFQDLLENKSDHLFAASPEGGVIERVCIASATFSSRLERKSLESANSVVGGGMRDQDMESVWRAEIEVLERRLNDWPDKSRPEFRRMVERKQLLQRELDTLRQSRAKAENRTQSILAPEKFKHSEDYSSVSLNGKPFTLTPRQAQVIQLLHAAYENGTPEIGSQFILEKIESPNSRLRDTFKSNPDAWKTLIKAGAKKGTVRLNI